MTIPLVNSALIKSLSPFFRKLDNPGHVFADAISMMLLAPGIRGCWPMSSISVSDAGDVSGQNRLLTNTNTAVFSYNDLRPFVQLNGSNQHFFRNDETGLDIIGNEAYILSSAHGLTFLCWIRHDVSAAAREIYAAKSSGSPNISWSVGRLASGSVRFSVSGTGSTTITVDSTDVLQPGEWYHIACRFDPSAEIAIFVNGTKDINTTSIPATLFNTSADFTIGATGVPGDYFDGRINLCGLYAMQLSDTIIRTIYDFQRSLYGVV